MSRRQGMRGVQYVILNIRFRGSAAVLTVRDFGSSKERELVVNDFKYIFSGVVFDPEAIPGRIMEVVGIRDRVSLLPSR